MHPRPNETASMADLSARPGLQETAEKVGMPSPITIAADALGDSLQRLDGSLRSLLDAIEPVLGPPSPQPSGGTTDHAAQDVVMSAMATVFWQDFMIVKLLTERVDATIERLQV